MIFFNPIKRTEAIEQERLQLWNDYQTYQQVEKSDELKTYLALKEKVESTPFKEKKKELEALRFKGSPEDKLLKQFHQLEKNSKLVSYFSLKSSAELDRFKTVEKSGIVQRLNELDRYMKMGQYKAELKAFKRRKKADKQNDEGWENSAAHIKKKELDELKNSSDVIFYFRFIKSSAYKNFLKVDGSTLLSQYEDIKTETSSEKFNERKTYLEDSERYQKTDDYKALTAFQKLDANPDIQLYMRYNDTDNFKFFRDWKPTFEENFYNIDKNVWSFITPIAEKGPGKNFSIKSQLQYYNLADNFDVENNLLTLETKNEQIEGLYWDEKYGFVPKTFNYVSGVIHTLNHFTQEYGHFEIKLKASKIKGVISSVSLVDDDEEVCIRLFTANANTVQGGLITSDQHQQKFIPVNLKTSVNGYVIVTLSWTPEKLEWSVNDKVMGRVTENIPHIPLGIRIETEVLKDTTNLPHRLDIDWIKCYKRSK